MENDMTETNLTVLKSFYVIWVTTIDWKNHLRDQWMLKNPAHEKKLNEQIRHNYGNR